MRSLEKVLLHAMAMLLMVSIAVPLDAVSSDPARSSIEVLTPNPYPLNSCALCLVSPSEQRLDRLALVGHREGAPFGRMDNLVQG